MPRVTARRKWKAEVELEIERIALNCQYIEKGRGSQKKRHLVPTDWLDEDGNIVWDVGKRVKGWLKEQVATMKKSWKERVQYGIVAKSLPQPGYVPIATIKNLAPSRNWHTFRKQGEYELGELPEPNFELIRTEKGASVFALHYVLNKPITVKCHIYGFAYGITPENVEQWMRELGIIKGLGDMHNSSAGYGCFTVKNFKVLEDKEIDF